MFRLHNKIWIWSVKEYLKSFYVWWGIAFHIITILGWYFTTAEDFRSLLWNKQFHLVFFVPMFLYALLDTYFPYRNRLKQWSRNKQNKKSAILLGVFLVIALCIDPIIIPFQIITIIGDQNKQWVRDYSSLQQAEEILAIYSFVTPIFLVYGKFMMNKILEKSNLVPGKSPEWMIPVVWMTFISLLIGFTVIIDP